MFILKDSDLKEVCGGLIVNIETPSGHVIDTLDPKNATNKDLALLNAALIDPNKGLNVTVA